MFPGYFLVVRVAGVEPAYLAWKASIMSRYTTPANDRDENQCSILPSKSKLRR